MRAALPGYEKIKLRKAAAPYQVRLDSGAPVRGETGSLEGVLERFQ